MSGVLHGVLVGPETASHVAAMIAEAVRRDPSRDRDELRRLRADLAELAETVSEVGRPVDADDGPWLTTAEVAAELGISERTVTRWAAAGRFRRTRREGWAWRIET